MNLQWDIPFLNSCCTLVIFKQYKISESLLPSQTSNQHFGSHISKSFNVCFTDVFIHIGSINKVIEHTLLNIHIYSSRVDGLFIWIHFSFLKYIIFLDSHLPLIMNFWYSSIFMLLGFYLSISTYLYICVDSDIKMIFFSWKLKKSPWKTFMPRAIFLLFYSFSHFCHVFKIVVII